jgi:hypothetical protein
VKPSLRGGDYSDYGDTGDKNATNRNGLVIVSIGKTQRRFIMIDRWMFYCLVLTSITFGLGCGIKSSSNSLPPPVQFYQNVPDYLAEEISDQLNKIRQDYPLQPSAVTEVRAAIVGEKRKEGIPDKEQTKKILDAGPAALPVIGDLLLSEKAIVRGRALLAMELSLKPGFVNKGATQYIPEEPVVINLLCRTLLDSNVEIRTRAVCFMGSLGECYHNEHRSVPKRIKTALEETMKQDPDSVVKGRADLALQDMGLRPGHPNRPVE